MKKMQTLFLALLLAAGMVHIAQAGRVKRSLIVMPVRYTVVQFAFDVARIRPVDMLAYDKGTSDEPLLLHRWDAASNNWKPADVAAYWDGSLFSNTPKQVFLVGGDEDLPQALSGTPAWAKKVTRVSSLKVLDMANVMGDALNFSEREWQKLAKRHNLKLVDENADLRRYGRYGKPGTEYTGPRPVNPLMARFHEMRKEDKPVMEEPVAAPVDEEEEEATVEEAPEADASTAPDLAPASEPEVEVDADTAIEQSDAEEANDAAAEVEAPVIAPEDK